MLMTQGKEEALFKRSQGVVKSVQKVTAAKNFVFYPHNPRMVPDQFKPELLKVRRHGGDATAPARTRLFKRAGGRSRGACGSGRQVNLVLEPPPGATHGGDDDAGRSGAKPRQARRAPDGCGVVAGLGPLAIVWFDVRVLVSTRSPP